MTKPSATLSAVIYIWGARCQEYDRAVNQALLAPELSVVVTDHDPNSKMFVVKEALLELKLSAESAGIPFHCLLYVSDASQFSLVVDLLGSMCDVTFFNGMQHKLEAKHEPKHTCSTPFSVMVVLFTVYSFSK